MEKNTRDIFDSISQHISSKLSTELSHRLVYHGPHHTFDVLEQSIRIAGSENIKNEDLTLLKIAALYHDTGFIYIYSGHEEKGCELAVKELPGFGLTSPAIEKICGMIMATRIPQSPKNKLEEILCDADLDYLGRDDFEKISNTLYKEFLDFGFVKNFHSWMRLQIDFFESHSYFTKISQKLRNPVKLKHLENLRKKHLNP